MSKPKYFKYLLCGSLMCLLISSAEASPPPQNENSTQSILDTDKKFGKAEFKKNDSYEVLKEKGFYLKKAKTLPLIYLKKTISTLL